MSDQPKPDHGKLLDAVVAVGAELDLKVVLRRIVAAAVDLVDAGYGALGVVAEDGPRLAELVHVGIAERTVAALGAKPTFGGVLGHLMDEPIRMADVTAHPSTYGFPQGHPPMRSFLGVPIRVRGDVFGNLYLAEKTGGGEFTAEDERIAHALATAAGVAVQNARLYGESRQREAWLRAASEVTRLLLSGAGETEVFTAIAEHVRRLSESTDAAVFLPREGELVLVAGVGPTAGPAIGMRLDPERSVTGAVFRHGTTANLSEAQVEAARAKIPHAPRAGPTLMVPLSAAGRTRGVLTASRPLGAEAFSAQAVSTVEGFAEQAELACELAERRRDGEALSLFADRDRIARNLHDLVIQRLFATGMALESAANLVGVKPNNARERIRRAVGDLDATIREIRTTVFALQQPVDVSWSLRARIIEVIDAAAATLGFAPSVQFDGLIDTTVADTAGEHLLAVLREALSNVARHAEAGSVRVEVSARERLVLRVTDDGIGLPAGPGRRSGLTNMAARAEQLGGEFTTGDAKPGTVVCWSVPVAPQ